MHIQDKNKFNKYFVYKDTEMKKERDDIWLPLEKNGRWVETKNYLL